MHILRLQVVDERAAVVVHVCDIHAVARKEVRHDLLAELPEVAGDDEVVILRRAAEVVKMRAERGIRGGRHRRAHIVRVLDTPVRDRADSRGAHKRSVWDVLPYDAAARARDGPLRRGRALPAVAQREAVLPLRRGKMG